MADTEVIKQHIATQSDRKNPFPGLRPFSIDDTYLFFGREGQSAEVIRNLTKYRFAAVTGASGEGKSSLIYCGVISGLQGGFIPEAGANWNIVHFRPGSSPIENLADALFNNLPEKRKKEKTLKPLFLSLLKRSSDGIVEVIKQMRLPDQQNMLLIVDQFEELFRFREATRNFDVINETESFIKLLTDSVSQKNVPVYIILTMRSDFMGECSQFPDLAQRINMSNYLIPRMSREDYKRVVTGPISVAGVKIEEQLVYELLNNVTDEVDSLSVIQHALMRTYEHWKKYSDPLSPISYVDYEAIGKIDNAISYHADEAFNELDEEGQRICRSMFTTLTERGEDNRGIRHPAKVSTIANVAQAPVKDTIEVINKFRTEGRAFLTPSITTPITADTVIDISHESIMRNWDRLKNWIDEEIESVRMYLRISEAAELYQLGKAGLWRPPDLLLAQNWRKRFKPNLAWAKRYNPAFERTMVFLDASEKRYQAEERNKIRMQKRTLVRTRRFASVLGVTAVIFLGLVLYANFQRVEAEKQRLAAEEASQEAEEQRKIAIARTLEAEELRSIAQRNAQLEQEKRAIAEKLSELSDDEKDKALQTATEAELESEILRQTSILERQQREIVEETLRETEKEKTEAQLAKEREYRQRILSISNEMAIRSLQINQNKNLKGLLAYQAYIYNERYNGQEHNSDIYHALLSSLKSFNDPVYQSVEAHLGAVRGVSFHPNANLFYTLGGEGKIYEWDINSPQTPHATIMDDNVLNRSMALSNDGKWLAAGTGENHILLFNLDQPQSPPAKLRGHTGWIWSLAFTPDNSALISSSGDKSIIAWNLSTFEGRLLTENNSGVRSISSSPDGRYVIGGTDDGRLILWNLQDQNSIELHQQQGNTIYAVNYSDNGRLVAFGDKNGQVKLLNPQSGNLIRTLSGHKQRILNLDFSPNGRYLASSSLDGSVRLWSLENLNMPPIVLSGHDSWVLAVAFSADSQHLVSTSQRGNFMVWPTNSDVMSDKMCNFINRNMNQSEWNSYVGSDIEYEKTCNP